MSDLRMLDRERIRLLGEEALEQIIANPPADARHWGVRITSGTTRAPVMAINHYSNAQFSKFEGSTNVLLCFGALGVRLSNTLHFRNSASSPGNVVSLDVGDTAPALSGLFSDIAPDTICGNPSFAVRAGERLGDAGTSVELLQLSGERITPITEHMLAGYFPHARILMTYAANEIGLISTHGCPHLPVNHYHPAPGVSVEILQEDETGSGMLEVTKSDIASSGGMAVERYRIGDTARFVDTVCQCGAKVTFEHLGRDGHDYLKLMGALIRREEFDRVALALKNRIDDYRVEAREIQDGSALKGSILLYVFSHKGPGTPALAGEIARDFSREVFLTATQTYADLVAKKLFLPLVVEFSPIPFPQKHKDVKLIHV